MTREDFLLKASVIGEYIKRFRSKKSKQASKDSIPFPENTIGIMLPALSATSLLLVGVYIAGKIPVMLNWTVGEKSFAHCMNFAHLDTILTSRKFYEKVRTPWLVAFEGKMVFIEDIIRDISLFTKVKAVIRKTLSFYPRQQDEAIILFTS